MQKGARFWGRLFIGTKLLLAGTVTLRKVRHMYMVRKGKGNGPNTNKMFSWKTNGCFPLANWERKEQFSLLDRGVVELMFGFNAAGVGVGVGVAGSESYLIRSNKQLAVLVSLFFFRQ